MTGIKYFLYFSAVSGNFLGEWIPRLANWNTGRLYFGDNYSFGVYSYGPVCQGTREESISGPNGKRKMSEKLLPILSQFLEFFRNSTQF